MSAFVTHSSLLDGKEGAMVDRIREPVRHVDYLRVIANLLNLHLAET